MTHLFVLGGMSLLFSALSGYCNARGKHSCRLVAKLSASLMFFLVGLGALNYTKEYSFYATLVLLALMFGMFGDVFLCINPLAEGKNKLLFDSLGLATFLVGHLVFIVIFLSQTHFNFYLLPILLVMPAGLIVLNLIKVMNLGKLAPAYIAYSVILGLMMISTINYYINMPSTKSLMALIAGILFSVSDCTIAYRKFGKSSKAVHTVLIFIVLLTYYTAQVLFALTIAIN
ncbi:MAG: lysoplasmalogenase [Clostridia bacterium]